MHHEHVSWRDNGLKHTDIVAQAGDPHCQVGGDKLSYACIRNQPKQNLPADVQNMFQTCTTVDM